MSIPIELSASDEGLDPILAKLRETKTLLQSIGATPAGKLGDSLKAALTPALGALEQLTQKFDNLSREMAAQVAPMRSAGSAVGKALGVAMEEQVAASVVKMKVSLAGQTLAGPRVSMTANLADVDKLVAAWGNAGNLLVSTMTAADKRQLEFAQATTALWVKDQAEKVKVAQKVAAELLASEAAFNKEVEAYQAKQYGGLVGMLNLKVKAAAAAAAEQLASEAAFNKEVEAYQTKQYLSTVEMLNLKVKAAQKANAEQLASEAAFNKEVEAYQTKQYLSTVEMLNLKVKAAQKASAELLASEAAFNKEVEAYQTKQYTGTVEMLNLKVKAARAAAAEELAIEAAKQKEIQATQLASARRQVAVATAKPVGNYSISEGVGLGNIKEAGESLDTLKGKTGELHSAVRGLASGVNAMWLTWGSSIAAMAAGAAVSHMVVQTVKMGAEVGQALGTIQNLAGVGVDDIGKLNAVLLETARSGPFGPKEVAKALETLALAGLSATEQIAALKPVLDFAVAGGLGIDKAADALVSIGTAFGYTKENLSVVADVVAKTAAISMTSVEGMSSSFKVASVVAQQYKVSIEDVATSLALLSSVGIKEQAAGTAVRNMYNELMGSSDKAKKVLKDVLNFDLFDKTTNSVKPLSRAFAELSEAFLRFNPESQLKILNDLGNERGTKAISANLEAMRTSFREAGTDAGTFVSKMQEVQRQLADAPGFSAIAAIGQSGTTQNQMKATASAFQSAMVEAFQTVEPAILRVTLALQDLFKSEGFRSGVLSIVESVANLTRSLVEHIGVIIKVAEVYAVYKVASLSWAVVGWAQKILQDALTVAATRQAAATMGLGVSLLGIPIAAEAAATGLGVFATALGAVNAASGWVGAILVALTTAYTAYQIFFKEKESLETQSESAASVIRAQTEKGLDAEIERLERLVSTKGDKLAADRAEAESVKEKALASIVSEGELRAAILQRTKADLEASVARVDSFNWVPGAISYIYEKRNAIAALDAQISSNSRDTQKELERVSDKFTKVRELSKQAKELADNAAKKPPLGGAEEYSGGKKSGAGDAERADLARLRAAALLADRIRETSAAAIKDHLARTQQYEVESLTAVRNFADQAEQSKRASILETQILRSKGALDAGIAGAQIAALEVDSFNARLKQISDEAIVRAAALFEQKKGAQELREFEIEATRAKINEAEAAVRVAEKLASVRDKDPANNATVETARGKLEALQQTLIKLKTSYGDVEKIQKAIEDNQATFASLTRKEQDQIAKFYRERVAAAAESERIAREELQDIGKTVEQIAIRKASEKDLIALLAEKRNIEAEKSGQGSEAQRRQAEATRAEADAAYRLSALAGERENATLKEQIALIGLTTQQINARQIATVQLAIAQKSAKLSALDSQDVEVAASLRKEIEALDSAVARLKEKGDLIDQQYYRQAFMDLGKTLEESLFNGGKGAGKAIQDYFKKLVMYTFVTPLMQGAMGAVGTALGMPGATSAGGSLFSTASSLNSMYNTYTGMTSAGNLSAAGSYLTGSMSGANAAGSIFANTTGTGIDGLLATNGAYGTASGAAAAAGSAQALAAGTAASEAALAAGATAAEAAAAAGAAASSATVAAGGMTAALAAVPVYGWVALAAIAAYGLFSGGGEKPSIEGGYASAGGPVGSANGKTYVNGTYGGKIDGTAKALVDGVVSDYAKMVALVGGQAQNLTAQAFIGLNQGDNNNPNALHLDAQLGSKWLYNRWTDNGGSLDAGKTTAEMTAAGELSSKKIIVDALQATNLGPVLNDYLKDVTVQGKTIEEINAILADVASVGAFEKALKDLPFNNIKDQSVATVKALADAAGGMSGLQGAISSFYNNYYTTTEKTAFSTQSVAKALSDVGLGMPKTRDAFKDLVNAQDLTTDSGKKAYIALLSVQEAFAQLTPSAEQIAAANKPWQDKLDILTGKSTARQIQYQDDLAAATDESTKALIRRTYALEDEKVVADAIAKLSATTSATNLSLLQAQGKTQEAADLQRILDLKELTKDINDRSAIAQITAAYDYNVAVKAQITLINALKSTTTGIASVLKDSMLSRTDQSQVGTKIADMITSGIEDALATSVADQISNAFTTSIIAPILNAVMTGAAISGAVSQATIDGVVRTAQSQLQAVDTLLHSPSFQALMDTIANATRGLSSARTVNTSGNNGAVWGGTVTPASTSSAGNNGAVFGGSTTTGSAGTPVATIPQTYAQLHASVDAWNAFVRANPIESIGVTGKIFYRQEQAFHLTAEDAASQLKSLQDELAKLGTVTQVESQRRADERYLIDSNNLTLYDRVQALKDEAAATELSKASIETKKSWQDRLDVLQNKTSETALQQAADLKAVTDHEALAQEQLVYVTDAVARATLNAAIAADEATKALINQVYAQQQLTAATDVAKASQTTQTGWVDKLKVLKGNTSDSALQHAKDLSTIEDHEIEIRKQLMVATTDATKAELQRALAIDEATKKVIDQVYALQALTASNSSRSSWQTKLDVLQGRTTDAAVQHEKDLAEVRAHEVEVARQLALTTDEVARAQLLAALASDEATRILINQVYAIETAKAAAAAALASAKTATDAAMASLQRAVEAQKKIVQAQLTAANELVGTLTSIFDTLKTNVAELYSQVESTQSMSAREGMAFITNALANAQTTGYMPDAKGLTDAIASVRKEIDLGNYATTQEAEAAKLILAGKLDQLKAVGGLQLTAAEQAAKDAQAQLDALDKILTDAQTQIDTLRGIDTSVISVQAAVDRLAVAILAEKAVTTTTTGTGTGTSSSNSLAAAAGGGFADINAAQKTLLNNNLTSFAKENFKDPNAATVAALAAGNTGFSIFGTTVAANAALQATSNASLTASGLVSKYLTLASDSTMTMADRTAYAYGQVSAADLITKYNVPTFWTGGDHLGGMRVVGEHGPELEMTGPSRIWDAATTSSMLRSGGANDDEVRGELAAMSTRLDNLRIAVEQQVINTSQTNKKLDQVLVPATVSSEMALTVRVVT